MSWLSCFDSEIYNPGDIEQYRRCTVHFYHNVFSHVPAAKLREVARMLKAIHAQEQLEAARAKAQEVVASLRRLKLRKAAELVGQGIEEMLASYEFANRHWTRIRTNNPLERIIREIRWRTRVVGAPPVGNSALMPCTTPLAGHTAGTK